MEEKNKHARLDDVLLRANELGIEYHPVGLKGGVSLDAFNVDLDEQGEPKTFQYASVERDSITVYESLYDVFDDNKGVPLAELPEDAQQEVVDRLFDSFFAENDQMVVVYDKQEVPSYALGALINGDFSGIEDPEDEQNIRDFMDKKAGYIYDVEPDSEGFSSYPAFGLPTDCESVFFVKAITPKELLEQQKAGSNKELESAMEVKVDPELREARESLMGMIDESREEIGDEIRIEPTSVSFGGRETLIGSIITNKDSDNIYYCVAGYEDDKDNILTAEAVNEMLSNYSSVQNLSVAVRKAQIASFIGAGHKISFKGGRAVYSDTQSTLTEVDVVKCDKNGKLEIAGHRSYEDDFGEEHQLPFNKIEALNLSGLNNLYYSVKIHPSVVKKQQAHVEIQSLMDSIDNAQEMLVGDEINQNEGKDEFLNYVVYGERRYPIYQNMENRLNAFMKNSGVDIPLSHILYGENTKVNRWGDLHQIASRAVEGILRESGQGDGKLLNSTTTDYVSDKAKTLALDIVRSIRVDEVNYETRREEALKAIGYPYLKHTTNADGSFNIPTVDESLYWEYAAGVISLKDAAREFNRSGWTNFVDEKYTKAKFAQLNEQFGKLDADLKPLLAQQKELGEAKENLMNTLDSAKKDMGDTILIQPTNVRLTGIDTTVKAVFLALDGKGGGEFRLAGEDYAVLAVGNGNHEEFDITKILDNAISVNALTKAVHDAHVINLEQKSKQAICDRIVTPSARSFTPNQVDALNRYHQIATPETPAREVFARLLHEVSQEPDVARKPEKWIADTAKELDDVAKGNTREDNQQLKR